MSLPSEALHECSDGCGMTGVSVVPGQVDTGVGRAPQKPGFRVHSLASFTPSPAPPSPLRAAPYLSCSAAGPGLLVG